MRSWLLNDNCYDQFSVIYNGGGNYPDKAEICYNTPTGEQSVFEREVHVLFEPILLCCTT